MPFNPEQMPLTEKKSEEQEKFEPITPEDMKKWEELKLQEFRLASKGKWESKDPEWLKNQEELREIEVKRELERENLTGPVFDRIEVLTDPGKQKSYVDFLKEWDGFSEEERMKRLDRVWNELGNMRESSAGDRKALMKNIGDTNKAAENYLKFSKDKNFRPLRDKEDREWQKLVDKYKWQGGLTREDEWRRLSELENGGQVEQEVLFGPDLGHFGPLMSDRGRKEHLNFIQQWNNLDSEEKNRRLSRANIINERFNTPMLHIMPKESIFERLVKMRAQKEQKEK